MNRHREPRVSARGTISSYFCLNSLLAQLLTLPSHQSLSDHSPSQLEATLFPALNARPTSQQSSSEPSHFPRPLTPSSPAVTECPTFPFHTRHGSLPSPTRALRLTSPVAVASGQHLPSCLSLAPLVLPPTGLRGNVSNLGRPSGSVQGNLWAAEPLAWKRSNAIC